MNWNRVDRRVVEAGVCTEPRVREASDGQSSGETGTWWTQASLALLSGAVAIMAIGCSPQSDAQASAISERAYTLMPDAIRLQSGTIVADIVRMKVTERIEERTGRIASPAKLSGRLFLENTSLDEVLRLIGGQIVYLDAQGQAIPLENGRAEPTIQFATSSGEAGRLDPSKVTTELLYAEFPTDALRAGRLKAIQIKLLLSSIPGVTDERLLKFAVSIGAP